MLRAAAGLLLLSPVGATVLILGDSIAEFSGRAISEYCVGQSFVNMAVGGTNASQWGHKGGGSSEPEHCQDIPHKPCRPSAGFALEPIIPYTHVWFSIGADDFMKLRCAPTDQQWQELINNVQGALDNIVAAAPPDIPVVMIRYSRPGMRLNECMHMNDDGSFDHPMSYDEMVAGFDTLNEKLGLACSSHPSQRCQWAVVDNFPAANTERSRTNTTAPDAFDSCTYHRDGVHLNNHGFCYLFTHDHVQTAFGCQPAAYDCSKSGTTIPGSPELINIEGECADYVFDPEAVDKIADRFVPKEKRGAAIGNVGNGKTDFHFVMNSQSATPAMVDAVMQTARQGTAPQATVRAGHRNGKGEMRNLATGGHDDDDDDDDDDAPPAPPPSPPRGHQWQKKWNHGTWKKAPPSPLPTPSPSSSPTSPPTAPPSPPPRPRGALLEHQIRSPLLAGVNGTALRGLLDVNGQARFEVYPGFTVTKREQEGVPRTAALVIPPQTLTATADNALQPR